MTIHIAHISDTHFGTEIPPVMAALHKHLHETCPDVIILSGDITQRARRGEFLAARAFADSLPAPVLAVPGNHDIPLYNILRRFIAPYGRYEAHFGERNWLWQGQGIAIIGFDATDPKRHTRGALAPARTRSALLAARQTIGTTTPLLAVIHQPLVVALPQDEDERLINAPAIAAALAEYGVRAVLSGHVHVPYVCTLERAFPGVANLPLHCGAGTAFSHRIRPGAPNSYNTITIDNDGSLTTAVYFYDAEKDLFSLRPAT